MQRHAGLERLLRVSGLLGDAHDCGTSQPLAYDGAGRLYAYGKDHVLRSVSVREQLLDDSAQEAAQDDEVQQNEQRVRLLQPDTALPCDAERLHINRAGTYALVYGHGNDAREDGAPALHVVSLTQREEDAVAMPLEDMLLVDRPGLQILQAAWHPGSDVHFATLTSDNIFRLYHVDDLTSPEQQVELRLRERQPLGLTDMEGSQAAAFTFGSLHLWERFAVFFACSDGKLFVVTPIAPFGCAVPASALHRLHAHTDAATEAASRSCARAWLQQAFPSLGHADTSSALGSVTCHPAALDEHAPALQGPLHLTAPGGARHDSLLDFLDADDDVVACQMLGSGGAVGCLAVGTAGAAVGLLAIADAVQPCWAPQPPQATLDSSGSIVTTRSQAVRHAVGAPQVLLLDVVHLQEEAGQHASATPLQLLPSPAESDSLYAAHASGVVAVKLPWLPRLAALVSGADGDGSDRAPLPATAVQDICSHPAPISGFSVIGDALLGAAVVAADASGGLHCLAPAAGAAAQLLRQPQSAAAASPAAPAHSPDVEAAVTEHFGQLLSQPASDGIVPDGPRYAGTPDGQRALADAVAALRERHVEFAHAAHHDLLQHAKRLQGNAAAQERQLAQLQRQAARLAAAAAAQEQQLQRATDLHDNLEARFRLLASLHWSLPQPMSAAEASFSAKDLPALERIAADLKRKCRDAASRVNAAQDAAAAQPRLHAAQQPPALPPSQVRRVREALGEQAAVLVANRAKARAIADSLAAEV